MIKLNNHGTGLDFYDWIDVLLNCPDMDNIGLPSKDLDSREQIFWLDYLIAYRQGCYPWDDYHLIETKIPEEIELGRGIGNWENPEYIILIDQIQPSGSTGRGAPFNSPAWQASPKVKRLRPFMESKKRLDFFYNLFSASSICNSKNTYITSITKQWAEDELISSGLLWDEYKCLLSKGVTKKVISLGEECYIDSVETIKFPVFYSTNHTIEWRQFRQQFNKALIC